MAQIFKFSRYDSADYLKTPEDIEAYLVAVIEESSEDLPGHFAHALGVVARAQGMSALAQVTGMTREGLYKALNGKGNPSFATVVKVLKAMGFSFSITAARAGA